MRIHNLASSLEEFGLSGYEAGAYLTLLGKGPLSASEIAYYANLPRTKIYSTLTKLAKKDLVIITQDKPLVCTAVSPEDAFGKLLSSQESKISDMKNTVTKLQKISEESIKPHGMVEHKYTTLDPDSVLVIMNELIRDTKEEIACIIDGWGFRIISQCNHTILKSMRNKIGAKILVSRDCLDNDILSLIPYGAVVRIGNGGTNLFIFDKSTIVIVNSSNGRGALFRSTDILSGIHNKVFNVAWADGMDASFLMPLDKELAKTTMKLISVINHKIYGCIANSVINDNVKKPDIIQMLESDGIKLDTIDFSDMLRVINASMGITCSSSLKYDNNNNIITMESHNNGKYIMPWALLLTNYLEYNNINTSVFSGIRNGKDFVHIKIVKN